MRLPPSRVDCFLLFVCLHLLTIVASSTDGGPSRRGVVELGVSTSESPPLDPLVTPSSGAVSSSSSGSGSGPEPERGSLESVRQDHASATGLGSRNGGRGRWLNTGAPEYNQCRVNYRRPSGFCANASLTAPSLAVSQAWIPPIDCLSLLERITCTLHATSCEGTDDDMTDQKPIAFQVGLRPSIRPSTTNEASTDDERWT